MVWKTFRDQAGVPTGEKQRVVLVYNSTLNWNDSIDFKKFPTAP